MYTLGTIIIIVIIVVIHQFLVFSSMTTVNLLLGMYICNMQSCTAIRINPVLFVKSQVLKKEKKNQY
jgi:hypothetical protein